MFIAVFLVPNMVPGTQWKWEIYQLHDAETSRGKYYSLHTQTGTKRRVRNEGKEMRGNISQVNISEIAREDILCQSCSSEG